MNIPIKPNEARALFKFFESVDLVISKRLLAGFNPHEEHLNSLFCEMMDENMTSEHNLSYTLQSLKKELTESESLFSIDLRIETKKYPAHIEKRITGSDFGIILNINDNYRFATYRKAIVIQAKRLHAKNKDPKIFSVRDTYKSFDSSQLLKLATLINDEHLRERIGNGFPYERNFAYYLFYNPPLEGFNENSQKYIQYNIASVLSSNIFDHTKGFHIYDSLTKSKFQIKPGILISNLEWLVEEKLEMSEELLKIKDNTPPRAEQVYSRIFSSVNSFPWFMVYDFIMGGVGNSSDTAINIASGNDGKNDYNILPSYVIQLEFT